MEHIPLRSDMDAADDTDAFTESMSFKIAADESITEINCDLRLIQKRDGLTFGSDAYLLAAYVRSSRKARAVDLGSGTGVIPLLLLSKNKIAMCNAVEVQPDFAELLSRNAEINGFSERLRAVNADVRDISAKTFGFEADIVISNPPYMKTTGKLCVSGRKQIARHEVFGGISDFCQAAARVLRHGGLFYTVWRPDRLPELVFALKESGLEPKRMTMVHSRLELPPCLVLCESKKASAPGCYVTPPLIMYTEGSVYTDALNKIYEMGDFDEHFRKP